MALTTKADLKTAVIAWLDRDDMAGVIDTCIALCEATIVRRLEAWFYDSTDLSTTLYSGTSTCSISGLDPQSIAFTDDISTDLVGVTPERLKYWGRRYGNQAGRPRYFAVIGNEIHFAPTADVDYDLFVYGEGRLEPLVNDTDFNELLLQAPDVYLYGVLAETAPYNADDARIPTFAGRFEKAIEELRLEKDKRNWNVNTGTRLPKNPL